MSGLSMQEQVLSILQLIYVTREQKPRHVIRVSQWTGYVQWRNGDHIENIEDLIEICENGFDLCRSKGCDG